VQRLTGPPDMQSSSSRASRQAGGRAGGPGGRAAGQRHLLVAAKGLGGLDDLGKHHEGQHRGDHQRQAPAAGGGDGGAVRSGAVQTFQPQSRGVLGQPPGQQLQVRQRRRHQQQPAMQQAGRQAGSGGSSFRTHLEEKAMARPITTMDRF
jgi:hypothetical protein